MSLDNQSGADERLLAKWREMFPSDNNSLVNGIQFAKAMLLEQAQSSAPAQSFELCADGVIRPSAPANPNAMPIAWYFEYEDEDGTQRMYNGHNEFPGNSKGKPLYATPADMPASDAAKVRKGFWDVYEPNNHKRIYVTVFNSAEAESYAENGYKVVEQNAAAPKECALPDDAIECLQDVISHHRDFEKACWIMVGVSEGSDDESYWMKQVKVLERMKAQAERAISAAPQQPVAAKEK